MITAITVHRIIISRFVNLVNFSSSGNRSNFENGNKNQRYFIFGKPEF